MTVLQLRRSSIVSNSGTISRSSAPSRGRSKPCFLQQHSGFENVGDAGRLRDHVMRHRARPVTAMRLGSRAKDRNFALGLGRIGEKGRRQRACRRQLRRAAGGCARARQEPRNRGPVARGRASRRPCARARPSSGADRARRDESRRHRRRGASPSAARGQDRGAIGDERASMIDEIGQQFVAVAIGGRVADGLLREPRGRRAPAPSPPGAHRSR